MLSSEDRRWLEQSAGSHGRRLQQWTYLAAGFLVVTGIVNLAVAVWVGHFGGYHAVQLARDWVAGVQLDRHYSGIYVKAMERVTIGILQLGVALLFALKARLAGVEHRRHQRLLEALRSAGGQERA